MTAPVPSKERAYAQYRDELRFEPTERQAFMLGFDAGVRAAHEPPAVPIAWRRLIDSPHTLKPEWHYTHQQPTISPEKWTPVYERPTPPPGLWQPIETAPKDMKDFLGWECGSVGIYYRPADAPDDGAISHGTACYPTHWMPLPSGPTKEA